MANAARSVRVTSYIQSNVAISRKPLIGPTIFWRRTIDQLYRAYTKTPNARGSCVRRTVVRQSRGDLQRPSSATSHGPPPLPHTHHLLLLLLLCPDLRTCLSACTMPAVSSCWSTHQQPPRPRTRPPHSSVQLICHSARSGVTNRQALCDFCFLRDVA